MPNEYFAQFNIRVPMRDGVTLSGDLFRPIETKRGARVPAILVRTPYNKNQRYYVDPAYYFASNGYAYLTLDVRGRGDSDGEFIPYANEGRDGFDAIEWCAAQDWCTGDVGTLGASYLGRVQWLAALEQPPHLKTMVVLVPPSDPFVESPLGVQSIQHIWWLYAVNGRLEQRVVDINWEPIYWHLPLLTMDQRAGFDSKFWREELAHPTLDEFWEPICYQTKFDQINLPVLHISGWYDDNQSATPRNFVGMKQHAPTAFARENQKLLIGPWGHDLNTSQSVGEIDFGTDAKMDLRGYERRWFDHWLKRADTGIMTEPAVRLFVMGENKWRAEDDYPLARTQFTHFYLHSNGNARTRLGDGILSTEPPRDESPDTYLYDPLNPTPYILDPTMAHVNGPDDYSAIQLRADVLVYITPPLEQDVEITGPIKLILYAASSAVDADFAALFFDLHPGGFAQRLTDSIVRARYRDGMKNPSLIEPHRIYQYKIDLWHTSQLFFKGHRIGVQIASSAFPKFDRNASTAQDIATRTRLESAQQTIYHDADHPSALVLPIAPPLNNS